MRNPIRIVLLLALTVVWPLAAAAQRTTDQMLWQSTFQGRLAILWITELGGETVVIGKTYRPEAMHRVTIAVTGQKAPGGTKKQAKLMAYGNSGHENAVEQVLAASYPLTVRATLRVPERLPKQGKPAILKQPPAPGSSIGVFCSLTNEEKTMCVSSDDSFVALDRATCERLAADSDRLDAAACAELPEESPVASVLELESRDEASPPGR